LVAWKSALLSCFLQPALKLSIDGAEVRGIKLRHPVEGVSSCPPVRVTGPNKVQRQALT
jgi:hypothetical protein